MRWSTVFWCPFELTHINELIQSHFTEKKTGAYKEMVLLRFPDSERARTMELTLGSWATRCSLQATLCVPQLEAWSEGRLGEDCSEL